MSETIGRNEPCSCGSGKKYKKCCGMNEAVSITHVIETEIDNLQKEILQFASYYYAEDIEADFLEFEETVFIHEEQERQFYELMHAVWYIFFEPLDDGETIIEKFIKLESAKIKRPKLRGIVRSWTETRTIAGKVTGIEMNKLTVEDGLTSEVLDAIIANKPFEIDIGSFIVGVLVPYEQNYVFYPVAFDLQDIPSELAVSFIKDSSLDAGYESPAEYFTDFFLEMLYQVPMLGETNAIDTIDWPAPIYKEVAEIFERELAAEGESELVVQTGILLWSLFCQKKQKRIQNPNIYVAALHYLLSTFVPMESDYTQKEAAERYGVSTGTVSSVYREMERELETDLNDIIGMVHNAGDMPSEPPIGPAVVLPFDNPGKGPTVSERVMQETLDELQGRDFESIEEVNEFMNKRLNAPASKKTPKDPKERARQQIYNAFETEGPQRYKLAKEALNIDPNCVDAYVILAEIAGSLEEAAALYEKGMKAGEKELGKSFFLKNKGHFWGLIETRPYLRAKSHYADALYHLGKINRATQQYEEILELNPMDNQGVRYTLFPAYLDKGNWQKADKLLKQYEEGTAHGIYNQLLLELFTSGFTTNAEKLLKEAKRKNKYVIPLLTGKKRLPREIPSYYGLGNENEAIIYADAHLHLWRKINGLQEWLKTQ